MIWWCMKCYDFFWNYMICLHGCVNAWVKFALFFHFFHKSNKCWRSYAYAHVMNHWWCMTCYDFLFKPRWWRMHGCVDAWVKFALLKKMNYSCIHNLVWCMNFSFAFFENKFELIPISLLFLIHRILLLWFFFYFSKSFLWSNQLLRNNFFNHFF